MESLDDRITSVNDAALSCRVGGRVAREKGARPKPKTDQDRPHRIIGGENREQDSLSLFRQHQQPTKAKTMSTMLFLRSVARPLSARRAGASYTAASRGKTKFRGFLHFEWRLLMLLVGCVDCGV